MSNRKNLLQRYFAGFLQICIGAVAVVTLASISGCNFSSRKQPAPIFAWDTLTVTASAYNSTKAQTGPGNPNLTAWGDTLKPGMKVIAVSGDLLKKGLNYNTIVKIQGFQGEYVVKDKMHYRWKNKIDIYMGNDIKRARKWGRKKVDIFVQREIDTIP